MGYTLIIGEACITGSKEDAYIRLWAEPEEHENAPTFPNDAMTGKGNMRSPGYCAWSDFCKDTGLYGMFYGLNGKRNPYMEPDPESHREQPILAEHPGFAAINEADAAAVRDALTKHVERHGELTPGFRDWHERDEDAPSNASECAARARLIWLDYWVNWAVENCEHPVIANS